MNLKEIAELFVARSQMDEKVFYQLLRAWESSNPNELRDLLEPKFWLDLPMWLVSRTFTRLIALDGRQPELLDAYSSFLSIYCGPATDLPDRLHQEAMARREHQFEATEKAFESLPNSRWGDLVTVDRNAPDKFRPGRRAMVYAEIFVVKDSKMEARFDGQIGEWICEVLYGPDDFFRLTGEFAFLPERWLVPTSKPNHFPIGQP